ncbi:hypothetical protein [Lactococcus muris]|uniref:hypothetical protein n=1 Tax=Lactococcus muris TaxID=2941330 RepID=UPI00203A688B|nr:hypothetical protein [Lactococcus muris]
MRTDIDFLEGNNASFYLKVGEKMYEFKGVNPNLAHTAWEEIQKGDFHIGKENPVKEKILGVINSLGAQENVTNLKELLKLSGLQKFPEDTYKVGVLGDGDLVKYALKKLTSGVLKYERANLKCSYDYYLILTRQFNRKKQLDINESLFNIDKPYISLIFEPLTFSAGPLTIPQQTSCLNCKLTSEEENNYYGNFLRLFDDSEKESSEYIPEELLDLGINFINLQFLKQVLQETGQAIEPELAQTIMEYSLLDGVWIERQLIKNSRCEICFPRNEGSQIFEVKL